MRPVKNILCGYNILNKTVAYVIRKGLKGTQNQPERYNSETPYIVFLILEICAGNAAVFQTSHISGR
jgi:hypothetical protein